jgi:cell division protein FtsW
MISVPALQLSAPVSRDKMPVIDLPLLSVTIALLALGTVVMTSASMEFADEQYGNPFYHLVRHSFYLGAGFIAAAFVVMVPVHIWEKGGAPLLAVAVVLLCAVLVPGIGREVNGSSRWIGLGPINLQASEVVKLCVLVYLAGYLVRRQEEVRTELKGFLKPIAVLAVMIVLLLLEPDFGAVVVIMGASLGMMFLGGVRLLQFLLLIAVSLGAVILMALASPYRMQRLITFADPWADQFNTGYQLTQSLIAFGRGEWLGVGLGNSVQKLFYLPEAHTDFVFAIVAEELGMSGAILVLALFAFLVARIFIIARRAETRHQGFSAYLAYGIGLIFAGQVFINVGVNAGLLPTKGLTLPFLSYGGSSLVINCMMIAVLLRIDYEQRKSLLQALRKPRGDSHD